LSDNQVVVALDIGTTKICAVVGDVDGKGQVQILGVGQSPSQGIRKGVVVDIAAASQSIRAAVESASQSTGVEIGSVVVGVTGDHIEANNTRGVATITHGSREITEQDVQKALESARYTPATAGREVLHVLPRAYTVDGQSGVRHPVGMSGCRLEVETHVVTGATSFLQNVYKAVEGAGLVVELLVLEPLATCEAVLSAGEQEIGALVADIGGGTTDVAVVQDGSVVHSFVIPVGGSHVTNDLAIGLKTSRLEAERLKLDYGCALRSLLVNEDEMLEIRDEENGGSRPITRGAIADIIEPRMQELFRLVREELTRRGYDRSLTTAALSGGGSLLSGACEQAWQVLGVPTHIGRPRCVVDDKHGLRSPIYATAVGLLLYGAARHTTERRTVTTAHFMAKALEQIRLWFSRLFAA